MAEVQLLQTRRAPPERDELEDEYRHDAQETQREGVRLGSISRGNRECLQED